MFKCDLCNNITLPSEKMNRTIDKKRTTNYYHIYLTNKDSKKIIEKIYKEKNKDYYIEIEGLKLDGWYISKELETSGWEIEKELKICNKCKGNNIE